MLVQEGAAASSATLAPVPWQEEVEAALGAGSPGHFLCGLPGAWSFPVRGDCGRQRMRWHIFSPNRGLKTARVKEKEGQCH